MAEDQDVPVDVEDEDQDLEGEKEGQNPAKEDASASKKRLGERKEAPKDKPPCNPRIDELATPNKRMFLALWNEHSHHLPEEKLINLKQILQQLYAMSPEETAKYFAELRTEAKKAAMKKRLKQKLRKYLQEKHIQKQKEKAFNLFRKLLTCGLTYAAENPVPPLVSIRLRYLSDIILEQLCDFRKVEEPDRSKPDRLGKFLISVADWMAIAIERLYYAAQLSINEMTGDDSQPTEVDSVYMGKPGAASTPKKTKEPGIPLATSTPQSSPINLHDDTYEKIPSLPEIQKIPYYSFIESQSGNITTLSKTQVKPPFYNTYYHMGQPLASSTAKRGHFELPPMSFIGADPTPKKTEISKDSGIWSGSKTQYSTLGSGGLLLNTIIDRSSKTSTFKKPDKLIQKMAGVTSNLNDSKNDLSSSDDSLAQLQTTLALLGQQPAQDHNKVSKADKRKLKEMMKKIQKM